MSTPYPTPALPAPPGTSSNFAHPVSILKWDILCVSVCLSISTIVFVLRSWARVVVLRQWILEDCVFLQFALTALNILKVCRHVLYLLCETVITKISSQRLTDDRSV